MAQNALGQLFRQQPWDFQTPSVGNFLAPILQGIEGRNRDQQQALENARAEEAQRLQRDQFGLQQGRFGMERDKFTRDMALRDQTDPYTIENARLAPQATRAQIGATQASAAATRAQIQNIGQTDLIRNLRAAGIDPGSPQGQEIIRNSIKGGSPIDQAVAGMLQGIGRPQGQPGPPQAPMPQHGMPGQPQIMPQSNVAPQGDPNMILAQAGPQPPQGQPQAAPQQQSDPIVQTPLGPMPQSKAQSLAFGLAYQGKGEAGKMIMGGANPAQLEGATRKDLEERAAGSIESMARLRAIREQYKPEYLQIEQRIGFAWTDALAKSATLAKRLKPEQIAELQSYTEFRSDAVANTNAEIKFQTGATMTDAEAKRIISTLPNAGAGIFDGDSPPAFKAKLDAATRRVELATARSLWLRRNGFNGTVDEAALKMPLSAMPQFIEQRRQAIEQDLRKQSPQARPEQLMPLVQQRLRAEFGMGSI